MNSVDRKQKLYMLNPVMLTHRALSEEQCNDGIWDRLIF